MSWYPSLYGLRRILWSDTPAIPTASGSSAVPRHLGTAPKSLQFATAWTTSCGSQDTLPTVQAPDTITRHPRNLDLPTITIVHTISKTLTSTFSPSTSTSVGAYTYPEHFTTPPNFSKAVVPINTQDDFRTSTVVERTTSTITATASSIDPQVTSSIELPNGRLAWMAVIASDDTDHITSSATTSNDEIAITALPASISYDSTSSSTSATQKSALALQVIFTTEPDPKTSHSIFSESPPSTHTTTNAVGSMSTPVSATPLAGADAQNPQMTQQSQGSTWAGSDSHIIVIGTVSGLVLVGILFGVLCCIIKERGGRKRSPGDCSTHQDGLKTPNMEAGIPMQDRINPIDRGQNYPYVGESPEHVSRSELNAIRGKPVDSQHVAYESPLSPFADSRRGTVLPSDSASNLGPYIYEPWVPREQPKPYAYEKSVLAPLADPPLLSRHTEASIFGTGGEVQGSTTDHPVGSSNSPLAPPKRKTAFGRASLDTFLSDAHGVFKRSKE